MNLQELLYIQVVGASFGKGYHDPGGAKDMFTLSMQEFAASPYASRDIIFMTDSWPIDIYKPIKVNVPSLNISVGHVSKRYMGFAVKREAGDPLNVEFVNNGE